MGEGREGKLGMVGLEELESDVRDGVTRLVRKKVQL